MPLDTPREEQDFQHEAKALAATKPEELFASLEHALAKQHPDTPDTGNFFSPERYRTYFDAALELDPLKTLQALEKRQGIRRKSADRLGVVVEECRRLALEKAYSKKDDKPEGLIAGFRRKIFGK